MINGFNLSLVIFIVVIVFFVIDFWFMNRYDRKRESRKGWSWDYSMFAIGISLIVILQPWLFPSFGWILDSLFGVTIQVTGTVIILASFALHIWARRHLRQFYVERIELQHKHHVITTGPYAYVRHPIITTFFGLAIGLLLLNPSVITLVVLIYVIWDFLGAAKQEEELLLNSLPEYRQYMTQTPRFLPRLLKKS